MASTQTASEQITAAVTSWPGVEAGFGSRGEFGFQVGAHQLGHLHGDHVAHFGFPREVGAELREQGRVGPHPDTFAAIPEKDEDAHEQARPTGRWR